MKDQRLSSTIINDLAIEHLPHFIMQGVFKIQLKIL